MIFTVHPVEFEIYDDANTLSAKVTAFDESCATVEIKAAIEALKAALAQQGEKPVAWVDMENGVPVERPRLWQDNTHGEVALYAAAPAAQPDTWTDDGGWTFPVERQIIQTR